MVTFSDPYRSLASQRGDDQGCSAGSVRARSGRSVEVERPSARVYGVSFKGLMVTLSHPYRSLASQGGEDQGDLAGAVRARSGRSVEVERPSVRVYGVSFTGLMVTLSDPSRTLASQGGEDRGDTAGSTRAQSGRSVEVERPLGDVEVSLLRASMITLSHPYRSLASQGGEDRGGTAGSTRAQSGCSVEVERPFRPVDVSLLRASMVTLSDPYRTLASQGGEDQGGSAGPFALKVVVLFR